MIAIANLSAKEENCKYEYGSAIKVNLHLIATESTWHIPLCLKQ